MCFKVNFQGLIFKLNLRLFKKQSSFLIFNKDLYGRFISKGILLEFCYVKGI